MKTRTRGNQNKNKKHLEFLLPALKSCFKFSIMDRGIEIATPCLQGLFLEPVMHYKTHIIMYEALQGAGWIGNYHGCLICSLTTVCCHRVTIRRKGASLLGISRQSPRMADAIDVHLTDYRNAEKSFCPALDTITNDSCFLSLLFPKHFVSSFIKLWWQNIILFYFFLAIVKVAFKCS